jgi:N-acylneuraminate cytidylyltransferase
MRILALIPARSGSKRLPRKNIKLLGGIPLVNWSINAAQGVSEICDVLVSTNDQEIAEISRKANALVPWLRPEGLANDNSSMVDVALHALDWYESARGQVDGLILLQPTNPFRTKELIIKGINQFKEEPNKPIVGVTQNHNHPLWSLELKGGYLIPHKDSNSHNMRFQDLPQLFSINGSFYLISPQDLRSNRSFIGKQNVPLFAFSPREDLDIDTEWDFEIAEYILRNLK